MKHLKSKLEKKKKKQKTSTLYWDCYPNLWPPSSEDTETAEVQLSVNIVIKMQIDSTPYVTLTLYPFRVSQI